jgi:hypothetical protein
MDIPTICMNPRMSNYNKDADATIKHIWDILKLKTGMTGMPERFKTIITKYSTNKDMMFPLTTDEWVFDGIDESDETSICICSHIIHTKYYIRSKLNGNILRIGDTCVYKCFSSDHPIITQFKAVNNQSNYSVNGTGNNRICNSCGKHKISIESPEWKTVCRSCFKNGSKNTRNVIIPNGKVCSVCKKRVLENTDWRDKCAPCYKQTIGKSMNSNKVMVKCIHCNFNMVGEPEWKRSCLKCFIRHNKHRK